MERLRPRHLAWEAVPYNATSPLRLLACRRQRYITTLNLLLQTEFLSSKIGIMSIKFVPIVKSRAFDLVQSLLVICLTMRFCSR